MRRCLILSSVRTIQLGITAGKVGSMELITFFTTKNRARAHTSTPYPNSYCRMCAMSPSPYKKSKPPEKFMQEITFSCLLRVCVFSGLVHIFQRSNTRSARTVYHPHPERKPLTFILCVFCLLSVRLPPIFYFYLFFRLSSSFHAFHFPIIWYIFHALLIFFFFFMGNWYLCFGMSLAPSAFAHLLRRKCLPSPVIHNFAKDVWKPLGLECDRRDGWPAETMRLVVVEKKLIRKKLSLGVRFYLNKRAG